MFCDPSDNRVNLGRKGVMSVLNVQKTHGMVKCCSLRSLWIENYG